MRTETERQVPVGRAIDAKFERVAEYFFVAIT